MYVNYYVYCIAVQTLTFTAVLLGFSPRAPDSIKTTKQIRDFYRKQLHRQVLLILINLMTIWDKDILFQKIEITVISELLF